MGVLLVDASLFALLAGCGSLISHASARDKQRAEDVEDSADLS